MAPPRRRSARQRKLKEIVDTEGDKDFWTQEALVDADSDAEFDLNATSDEGEVCLNIDREEIYLSAHPPNGTMDTDTFQCGSLILRFSGYCRF